MANAPLIEAGWGELVEMICPTTKAENLLPKCWTNLLRPEQAFGDLPVGQISCCALMACQGNDGGYIAILRAVRAFT
jgi:hypothetical protein